jgi:DNA-binding transcriptional MerR regulator
MPPRQTGGAIAVRSTKLAHTGRYRMKAVAHLTGVRPELLRMWEKRYRLFKPQRADNRYREFDDEDVQLLLYIRQQIEQGRSIGELAAEGREALLRRAVPDHSPSPEPAYTDLIHELVGYIQRLEKARLDARLAECVAHDRFATVLTTVCTPLMHRLGELWAEHQLSIASERFATMTLKQRLLTMLQSTAPGASAPLVLCACPAGELHELGLLTFAYLMQQDGWQVCYLGTDLSLRDLYWSCERLQPTLVAVSLTYATEPSHALRTLQDIDTVLAPAYPTLIGGQALARYRSLYRPQHLVGFDTACAALTYVRQQHTGLVRSENPAPALGKRGIPQ